MYRVVEDGFGTDVFAFVDDAEMVELERGRIYINGHDPVAYSKKAFWFVSKGATKGALAYGDVTFEFYEEVAGILDGRNTYCGMSQQEVFDAAGREKKFDFPDGIRGDGKEIRAQPEVIFGLGSVWNDKDSDHERADRIFKKLVDAWFTLPSMPEGTSEWIKFSKK